MFLRQTIRLDMVASRASNGYGGFAPTWTVARGNVPAAIKPASARYAMLGQQLRARTTHIVRIRTEQREFAIVGGVVVYVDRQQSGKTRYFEILGILNIDEDERFIHLECEENAPAGYKDPVGDDYGSV